MTGCEHLCYNARMEFSAILISSLVVKISEDDYKSAVKAALKIADDLSEKTGVHFSVEQVQTDE